MHASLIRPDEVWGLARSAAKETGRVQALVSFFFGWLPYAFDSAIWRKTLALGPVLMDLGAMGFLSWALFRNGAFAALTSLVALVSLQATWEHGILTAYPFAFTMGFAWVLCSLALFQLYLDTPDRRRWLMTSAVLFALSTLIYELFVLYSVVFVLLAFQTRSGRLGSRLVESARACAFHLGAAALFVIAYVSFRRAFPSQYPAGETHLDLRAAVNVWLQFMRGALPTSAFFHYRSVFGAFSEAYGTQPATVAHLLRSLRPDWLVASVIAGVSAFALALRLRLPPEGRSRQLRTVVLSLLLFLIPLFLYGLTPQYQAWTARGIQTHVGTYFASYGAALLLALFVALTSRLAATQLRPAAAAASGAAIGIVTLLTLYSNQHVTHSQAVAQAKWRLVDSLLETHLFQALPAGMAIIAPSLWDSVNIAIPPDDYWTRYLRQKTQRDVWVARDLDQLRSACPTMACPALFVRYARDSHARTQYLVAAPLVGPLSQLEARGLRAHSAQILVRSHEPALTLTGRFGEDLPSRATYLLNGEGHPVGPERYLAQTVSRPSVRHELWVASLQTPGGTFDPETLSFSPFPVPGLLTEAVEFDLVGLERRGSDSSLYFSGPAGPATIVVNNPLARTRHLRLEFDLADNPGNCDVAVVLPGEADQRVTQESRNYSGEFRLAPLSRARVQLAPNCHGSTARVDVALRRLRIAD